MNQEQIVSLVRQVMLAAGGGLVTRGYLDAGTLQSVAGALSILAASGWALYSRRATGLVASAAGVPEVRTIVASPGLAAAVPSDKVVEPGRA